MVRKPEVEIRVNVRGGTGVVEFHHILSEKEMMGHGPMYAKMVLKPGSSIARHQHVGTKEAYYVLTGQGRFTDDDGTETIVGPGDVCSIECGHSHSVENVSATKDFHPQYGAHPLSENRYL
jgi:quercetin dioxygenase-like cupin family protein